MDIAFEITGELWKAIFQDPKNIFHVNQKTSDAPFKTNAREEHLLHHIWEIETQDLLVVPSLSFSPVELSAINGLIHYEERILYVLLALRDVRTRLVIVTTMPLDDWILRYHYSLLPPQYLPADNRVELFNIGDPSRDQSLAEKILERPRLLERLKKKKEKIEVMLVYRGTEYEEQLASCLGLPYYAAKPEHAIYGTKQGSRSLFRTLGIPCADGTYEVEMDLLLFMRGIWRVLRRNPKAAKGVVKLADGFSGMGNAILDLKEIQARLSAVTEANASVKDDTLLIEITRHAMETMTFHGRTWENFHAELQVMGAIFELFIESPPGTSFNNGAITSPSVQVVTNEDKSISVLSTHEQILEDQVYYGCEFPCREAYRMQLMKYGRQVGEYLAERGVTDHFSVDFMGVPNTSGQWDLYAVEINLRLTGTTHPFMTLKLLTHGDTDEASGMFRTSDDAAKFYLSSDNVTDTALKRLLPQDLCELITARPDLHWHSTRQTGVVFHMIGRMSECGILGITAIHNSIEEARDLFDETSAYIISEAKRSPPQY
jgi:hypothetical protein